MGLYRTVFDQFLVRSDPELIHHRALTAIKVASPLLSRRPLQGIPVRAMGLTFPNALGLAAGFDKNAIAPDALAGLGFGHIEIGTVTAEPQPGNPQPRLFRLTGDRALVNRLGFNNEGSEVVAYRLALRERSRHQYELVLGVNIGKSKVVPDDDQAAVEADYAKSTRLLAPYADYLVVNVSSPNTPGLRNLQAVERLEPLLTHVRRVADQVTDALRKPQVPLLVKIAPDLDDADVTAVAGLSLQIGLHGIIATNTTVARERLRSHPHEVAEVGAGGLSGPPLRQRAVEVIRLLKATVGNRLTLIGVGGIDSPAAAVERLTAGADLVQAYTGFIYGGPLWPTRMVNGVARG